MRIALLLGIVTFLLAALLFYLSTADRIAVHGATFVYAAVARSAFYAGLAVGSCAYAIRCGGAPERIVGIVILASVVADPLLHLVLEPRFHAVDPTHLIIDLVRFAAFVAVALRACRYWPIWLASFQTLALGAHAMRAMEVAIHPVAYGAMSAMWSYGMLALLLFATRFHRSLIGQGVNRKSWSDFSPR